MRIDTEITIDAAPELVWRLLTDLPGYAAWNPLIVRPRGRLALGETLTFRLAVAGLSLPVDAVIVECDPPRRLCWEGPSIRALRYIGCGRHYYELEDLGGKTRLRHGEEFGGALIPKRFPALARRLEPSYQALNTALKYAAESASA